MSASAGQYKPGTLLSNLQPRSLRPAPEAPPPPAAPPPPLPSAPPPAQPPIRVTSPLGVVIRSEGQRQLMALETTLREIADRLGDAVSVQAVSQWRRGDKSPAAPYRIALQDAYGIPVEAWGVMPQAPEAQAPAQPLPRKPGTSPNSLDDCQALLALIRDDRDRAGQSLLATERMKLVDAEARVLALMSRLEAQHELREDRYVRQHPAWLRARKAIVDALAPHPAAAKAVIDALRKINM